ncbi:MAG: hypothetical protein DID92_2727745572 [Candidatus Nitrotoga sp. SPKER]|nr:MAG: hypothetical protein DID92_2727745572 [Candidatus Nitrotoga sp. SPKER]
MIDVGFVETGHHLIGSPDELDILFSPDILRISEFMPSVCGSMSGIPAPMPGVLMLYVPYRTDPILNTLLILISELSNNKAG